MTMEFKDGLTVWAEHNPHGWEPQTYYKVEVELYPGNVRHTAIFFTGFLNGVSKHAEGLTDGLPGAYSTFWSASYDRGAIVGGDNMKAKVFSAEKLYSEE